jgi:hypothetical protein
LFDGTGKTFKTQDNQDWLAVTQPHRRGIFSRPLFLEMAVKYGRELDSPCTLPTDGQHSSIFMI